MTEQVFSNAKIVLAEEVLHGSLTVKDGVIHEIGSGVSNVPAATDLGGDYLMPGFVELHTDNLEKQMTPRPKTDWPPMAAVIAHDNQVATAGITTVFDALALGDVREGSTRLRSLRKMVDSIGSTSDEGLLRAEHFLHLRCEVSYADLPETLNQLIDNPRVRMLSVMDHTPGQRQFVCLEAYQIYYQGKYGLTDAELSAFIDERKRDQELYSLKHRQMVVDLARGKDIALASHDDATRAHVLEAIEDDMTVAEFPTTREAAKASHEAGLKVMMGAPNIVRGGSHSGNVSAHALAEEGYLDVISSDYVPHSLLHGALLLAETIEDISLAQAIRFISKIPADSVGLTDRGEIAPGKRADLVQVQASRHHPVVRSVWREGRRVA